MDSDKNLLCRIDGNWKVGFSHPETGVYYEISTSAPGSFALDLAAAGLINQNEIVHPASSEKIRVFEKVAKWECKCSFDIPQTTPGARQILAFHGIDTISEIKLNGEFLGKTENMFIRYEFDVTDKLLASGNQLEVTIIDPVRHAETMELDALAYWTSFDSFTSYIRRTRCLMSWDNAPRLVIGGLWRSVELVEKLPCRFEDCYVYTRYVNKERDLASIGVHFYSEFPEELRGKLTGKIKFDFEDNNVLEHTFTVNRHYYTFHNLELKDPELWWPIGYGKANLYDVRLELWHEDTLLACKNIRYGVRFVTFKSSEIIDSNRNGEFLFTCNHEEIYCRGTNWKPIDPFYCNITPQRLRDALDLALDCNCNMVRVWGGGIYEEQAFYDYCDEKGIMVWQDFMMACEFPLQSPENQRLMSDEAKFVIKELRNHPSIFLWCGDNEVDKGIYRPVRFPDPVLPSDNIITRVTIPQEIKRFDPFRFYIPSSPYISDLLAVDRTKNWLDYAPNLHLYVDYDVYHDTLRKSPAKFLAETGPIGFSAFSDSESIRALERDRIKRLWNALPPASNPPGCGHQSDTYFTMCIGKIKALLTSVTGEDFSGDDVDKFAPVVNFVSSEVFKDAVEYFRMNRPYKTGVLWWSLLDMFPMIFNYSVVDCQMNKKLPFYWLKQSQQQLCLMMDKNPDGTYSITAANDSLKEFNSVPYRVLACSVTEGNCVEVASGNANIKSNTSTVVSDKLAAQAELFIIEWSVDGETHCNHYFAAPKPWSPEFIQKVIAELKKYYKF